MQALRTEITPSPPPFRLSLQGPLLSVGSCFADVIGQRLQAAKFTTLANPFGTLFHPLPMIRLLHMALQQELPPDESYLQFQERWLNYLLHSSLHAGSRQQLEAVIAERLAQVRRHLQVGQALLLTLGTSFLYEVKQLHLPVANCHKQPQGAFSKRLTPTQEMLEALQRLWQLLRQHNPDLKLVLTVSPVRHLKDGLEQNALSKAQLRLLCHQLAQQHPQEIYYFPSYELLLDDLRDYRFYASDLLHPSPLAEQYVWEKFTACLLDDEARAFLKEWTPLQQSLAHRPFNPTSAAHRQFLENTLRKLQALPKGVDVSAELNQLLQQLHT
ncbi:GSCFA domain-containing protein [Cesiribacter andamanensis]|uniref:GSCFA family protein n=1 Tax=Cesiribacter andamanensis AMV16 TaxID=1279009 RepID=M7NK16_9BACT|nr:GSCFA domain-containing protein [Cesiribacter andamanensis]EMR02125.1 GSCFA family protein [Cesiribacter andamanensis AMV16]